MKKIFVGIIITMLLVTTGCGKNTESSVINDLEKKINKASAYKISGDLEIVNNDEVYNYDIEVSYKKDNNYKVILTNKANDHTQIILDLHFDIDYTSYTLIRKKSAKFALYLKISDFFIL